MSSNLVGGERTRIVRRSVKRQGSPMMTKVAGLVKMVPFVILTRSEGAGPTEASILATSMNESCIACVFLGLWAKVGAGCVIMCLCPTAQQIQRDCVGSREWGRVFMCSVRACVHVYFHHQI